MAICDNCGKELGFFDSKYSFVNNKGKELILCKDCYNIAEQKLEEEKQKEIRQKELEKKKKLEIILKENNKWEYKIINLNTSVHGINATGNKIKTDYEKELNKLGVEGWELIAAVPMDSLAPRLGVSSTATEWVSCIFKRKLI